MRIDFNFYTIYALVRAAGFSPDNAYVIAYSSQYTDDEVAEKTISFEDDEEFEPFITAHRIFDLHRFKLAIRAELRMNPESGNFEEYYYKNGIM